MKNQKRVHLRRRYKALKKRQLRRRLRQWRRRPFDVAVRACSRQWRDRAKSVEARLFAELAPSLPPECVDLEADRRLYCALLTTDPVFLESSERSDCLLLCAYYPSEFDFGSLSSESIEAAAVELFAAEADRESGSSLHLGWGNRWDFELDTPCSFVIPAYGYEGGFGKDHGFDERRMAKRLRSRKSAPDFWSDDGVDGPALWAAGLSTRSFRSKIASRWLEAEWGLSVHAVRQALLASGAKFVALVPGFFERSPSALDSFDAFSALMQSGPNSLEEFWELERAVSGMASAARSSASI